MSKIPHIVPVTDFRQGAARILRQVRDSGEPVYITQRGRPAAVMVSSQAFEKAEHDRQILRLLAKGDREIAAGKGHDLESVLNEADELLKKD